MGVDRKLLCGGDSPIRPDVSDDRLQIVGSLPSGIQKYFQSVF
jgi:hypothetical protein